MNRINWDTLSRIFIGVLFVYAGIGKLMNFGGTNTYINSVLNTGAITPIVTLIVIFIEIVVATVYILGKYKKDTSAYILICFTALATLLFHSDMSKDVNVLMSFKNLAIIGGIFATMDGVHRRRNAQDF